MQDRLEAGHKKNERYLSIEEELHEKFYVYCRDSQDEHRSEKKAVHTDQIQKNWKRLK